MNWIRENKVVAAMIGGVGVVILAYLAFGVFGIQTEFFDDEVSEEGPVFDSGAVSDNPSDVVDQELTDEMNDFMEAENTPVGGRSQRSDAGRGRNRLVTQFEGTFGPRSHPGEGTAKVLNDGTEQRFLRFEEFATDNGPDLNVYLTTADADADAERLRGEWGVRRSG